MSPVARELRTPPHVAVVLHVKGDNALERDAVAWVEACRQQVLHHLAPAWGWADPPGVVYYGSAEGLPPGETAVVGIFRDAGVDEAAGYHMAIGQRVIGAVDLSRSRNPSRTLSHEICEIYRNAYLDEWMPGPVPGRLYAVELCDPTQQVSYTIRVDVLGESRAVEVADFILPAWFDQAAELGTPRDHCRVLGKAFEIAPGGYQIAQEDGGIIYLPAKGEAVARAAITRPLSRTVQISNGITIPHPRGPGGPTS